MIDKKRLDQKRPLRPFRRRQRQRRENEAMGQPYIPLTSEQFRQLMEKLSGRPYCRRARPGPSDAPSTREAEPPRPSGGEPPESDEGSRGGGK